MNNVEKLRKSTKKKLIALSLATLLPIIIIVLMHIFKPNAEQETVLYDLIVFQYGIFVLVEGYIGIKIANYIRILNSIDYAQSEVIRKNDERNSFIELKSSTRSIKITFFILCIAGLVFAFFSREIFYTVLAAVLIYFIVYLFVKLYYSKKY